MSTRKWNFLLVALLAFSVGSFNVSAQVPIDKPVVKPVPPPPPKIITKTQPHGGKATGRWKKETLVSGKYDRWRTDSEREYTASVVKNGVPQGHVTLYFYAGSHKGDRYEGYIKDGSYDGQGTKTQSHGGKATGTWKYGSLYNGRYERYRTDSEREYTVNVVNGKYQGQGTVYYYSGSYKGYKYVGDFADGRCHGQGTATWASGQKYVGQWGNDKREGQGTLTWADGSKYAGQWKNGKREGFGTYYLSDGKVSQSGQWKDGNFVGKLADGNNVNQETKTQPHGGKATGEWKNGTLYNGRYERYRTDSEREFTVNVVNGKYQGPGTVYYYSGSYKGYKYVGDFADGRCHGQGTATWADGGKYVGQWGNDKREGQGTYTWANGAKFVGQWKNGKREGFGTYYLSDGKVSQSGQWKDDKFVGK